jgi:hypothetical protein
MARRSRSKKAEDTSDTELSYEEYSGAGARPRGTGGRRNVAPGAQEFEAEDYDEQNRRNVGGEGGAGIQTGNYEDDYGPGTRGFRHPEFHAEPNPKDEGNVLRRSGKKAGSAQDFPTGTWSAQKTTARLKKVKSHKIGARRATGRGVGVTKKPRAKATRGARPSSSRPRTKRKRTT